MKRRLIYGIWGYMLTGSASGLFIYCGLSADCFNTLVQGAAPFLRLPVGTTSCVIQMAMLLLVFLLGGRRYAGMGTFAGPVIITAAISFFGAVLSPVLLAAPLTARMLLILLATVLAALGLAFVQVSGLGSAANDILPILLSAHLPRLQFSMIRMLFDCLELVIGVLLGGSFGFGTVCAAILIGPLLQLFFHILDRPNMLLTWKYQEEAF